MTDDAPISTDTPGPSRVQMAWLALGVGISLLVAKGVATWLTGSRAVFSDAAESVVNVVAAVVVLLAVRMATKPADAGHPFGHGKIEALAAILEGALLIAAAIAILWEAIPAFVHPRALEHLGVGTLIVAGSAVVNTAMGWGLIRSGRRLRSHALQADGRHLLADAVSTLGVLAGLAAVAWTGWLWLDPAVACAMAAWVAWTGIHVLRDSGGALIDERRPEQIEAIGRALGQASLPGLLDPHDLRIVDAGSEAFVSLHVRAPRHWSVERGQSLRVAVEDTMRAALTVPVQLSVQVEPCLPRNCPGCSEAPCPNRVAPFEAPVPLGGRRLVAPEIEDRPRGSEPTTAARDTDVGTA